MGLAQSGRGSGTAGVDELQPLRVSSGSVCYCAMRDASGPLWQFDVSVWGLPGDEAMNHDEFLLLEERLENWRKTVRFGLIQKHCGSVEHRYRHKRGDLEARPEMQVPPDVNDGWLIEEAWRELAERFRWLIKLHYLNKLHRNAVITWELRKTGYAIKTWQYNAEVFYAVCQLKKVLDMRKTLLHNQPHNLNAVPSGAWPLRPELGLAAMEETN